MVRRCLYRVLYLQIRSYLKINLLWTNVNNNNQLLIYQQIRCFDILFSRLLKQEVKMMSAVQNLYITPAIMFVFEILKMNIEPKRHGNSSVIWREASPVTFIDLHLPYDLCSTCKNYVLFLQYEDFNYASISHAEKNSMRKQSRPESRQESRSARKESRIGSDAKLLILLDLFIIHHSSIYQQDIRFVDDDCMLFLL